MPGSRRRRAPSGPPAPRRAGRSPVDPARLAAFEVLKAVRVDNAYANLALPHVLDRLGLEGRDAAFVTELASGTLRQQGTYDAVLAACLDRPLAKVEAKVLDALRLGCHQLLSMRVPAHAALSTTVDLVRSRSGPGAAGFANAVLRRVAGHSLDEWIAEIAPDAAADHDGWAAVAFGHPRWVVEALADAVGRDEIDALLAADNEPPRVTLVARPGRATRRSCSPQGVRRRRTRPSGSCCPRGHRRRSRRLPTVAPACRTRGRSWWRSRSPRRAWEAARTLAGSTCVPARAGRARCSLPSPRIGVRS